VTNWRKSERKKGRKEREGRTGEVDRVSKALEARCENDRRPEEEGEATRASTATTTMRERMAGSRRGGETKRGRGRKSVTEKKGKKTTYNTPDPSTLCILPPFLTSCLHPWTRAHDRDGGRSGGGEGGGLRSGCRGGVDGVVHCAGVFSRLGGVGGVETVEDAL
jgi:hypothetical protein